MYEYTYVAFGCSSQVSHRRLPHTTPLRLHHSRSSPPSPRPPRNTSQQHKAADNMVLTLRGSAAAGEAVLVAAQYQGVTVVVEEAKVVDSQGNSSVELDTRFGTISSVATCLRYIANLSATTCFGGETPFAKAKVDQWIDFAYNEVLPRRLASAISAKRALLQTLVNMGVRGSLMQRSLRARTKSLMKDLTGLNKVLLSRSFLVTDSVTAADVALASACVQRGVLCGGVRCVVRCAARGDSMHAALHCVLCCVGVVHLLPCGVVTY